MSLLFHLCLVCFLGWVFFLEGQGRVRAREWVLGVALFWGFVFGGVGFYCFCLFVCFVSFLLYMQDTVLTDQMKREKVCKSMGKFCMAFIKTVRCIKYFILWE